MYLEFYGLREAPFSPTPDPKFLFQSSRHREALAQLVYGVQERKGFIVLTGEIGTGKTTLLRTLLARLDHDTHVAYVHNSALDIEGLLEYILQDWGVKSVGASHAQRLFELNEFLIAQHRQRLSPVLVIDEAQNLSIPTLEAVRLLSNFETTSEKLMQILLVGQPELRDKLNAPELRQLKQRIALRCHIGPLSPEETRIACASLAPPTPASSPTRRSSGSPSTPAARRGSSTSYAITASCRATRTASVGSTPASSRRRPSISKRASVRSGNAAVRCAWCPAEPRCGPPGAASRCSSSCS